MPDRDNTELSRALRNARNASGLRQLDVAGRHPEAILSQAQLSRIESGQSLPTDDEVRSLASRYGLSQSRADDLLRLARAARDGIKDSRLVIQRGNTLALQQRWRALERDAAEVRSFQPVVVLGTLQVPGYAAVAMQADVDSPEVQERTRRREQLDGPGPRLIVIQTEAALHQTVGSHAVMVDQLDAIDRASHLPRLALGVIPLDTPMPFLAGSGFHVYGDSAVVVGLQVAAATLTEPPDIAHFTDLFERLSRLAVWDDDARALVQHARQHHAR